MRLIAATLVSFVLAAPALGQGDQSGPKTAKGTPMPTLDDVRSVSPALARYTQGSLLSDVWKRPGLSPRDRSIVTLATLIARNQTAEMPYYLIPSPDEENPSLANPASSTLEPPGPLRPGRFRSLRLGMRLDVKAYSTPPPTV